MITMACMSWVGLFPRAGEAQGTLYRRLYMYSTTGLWLLLLGVALCGGCTGVASLAETLNAREVMSCVYATGAVGPYAHARIVSATGGASLDMCLRQE